MFHISQELKALLSTRKQNSLHLTSLFTRCAAKPTLTELDVWGLWICLGGGEVRKRTVHHPNGAVLIVVQKLPSATVTNLLRNVLLKVISRNLQVVDDTSAVIVNIFSSVSVCVCVCVPEDIQALT